MCISLLGFMGIFIFSDIKIKDFFFENMLAELLGILIEILIIIFIFEVWAKNKQDEKNIVYEKRLREYLLFFLKFAFKSLPKDIKVSTFYGEHYLNNNKEIDQIVKYIDDNEISLLVAKKHLLTDKTAIENLLDVASHLTDEHFKAWIRIVYFINSLSFVEDTDYKEIKKHIKDILMNIKKFDKASYENKIYVGAKKDIFDSIKFFFINNLDDVKHILLTIVFMFISLVIIYNLLNISCLL